MMALVVNGTKSCSWAAQNVDYEQFEGSKDLEMTLRCYDCEFGFWVGGSRRAQYSLIKEDT